MSSKKFSIGDRIKSLGYAFEGIAAFFKTQHNAWIHAFAAVAVIAAGICLDISSNDWCWVIVSIAMVFICELFNTAIEFLCDVVSAEIHPKIKMVKDVAAAAVLIASIGAVMVGVMVFAPYLYDYFYP